MTLKQFNQLCTEAKRLKHPNMAAHTIPCCAYKQGSTNELTKAIRAFLEYHGCQEERVSTEGRVIDKTKKVKDVLGNTRTIGSVKRIKTSGKKGSADVHCTVPLIVAGHKIGLSLKVEIKFKRDTQKDKQKEYAQEVVSAHGRYVIAKTFEQFTEYYFNLIQSFT